MIELYGDLYGLPVWPCLLNTQGGPKRKSRGQILNVWGKPIKRLYSAGEMGSMPTAGAIGNAIFDATGVRLRRAPFTPARVLAALKSR